LKPDCTPTLEKVIQIDEAKIHNHLGEIVRGTVEETLNAMLDAEADQLATRSAMSGPKHGRTHVRATTSDPCIRRPAK